jgi:hypothetical protein
MRGFRRKKAHRELQPKSGTDLATGRQERGATTMTNKREVNIALIKSEALVLFELLTRYSDGKIDRSLTVLDHAERQALRARKDLCRF